MLIEKDNYRRNKKTGEIIKRQVVSVRCDDCGKEWDSLFSNRKRKKLNEDLCKSCRSKYNLKNQDSLSKRRWSGCVDKISLNCSFCGKKIMKYPSLINDINNFCDMECRDGYVLKKYDILYDTFNKNPDEVAYLFGLILGDGNLRKLNQKNTTRIDIAFNKKEKDMIKLAKDIMSKLNIDFYSQIENKSNCVHLGFVLPDKLLKKYGMFWIGDKFDAAPSPEDVVVENINMAIGLINSDGHCRKRCGEIKCIVFNNTVESIFKSFVNCLDFNNVSYNRYLSSGRIDYRTGNKSRDSFCARINLESVNKIFKLKKYDLKGEKFVK